jgi:hypothetical protein
MDVGILDFIVYERGFQYDSLQIRIVDCVSKSDSSLLYLDVGRFIIPRRLVYTRIICDLLRLLVVEWNGLFCGLQRFDKID